jgi:hypothetical protein
LILRRNVSNKFTRINSLIRYFVATRRSSYSNFMTSAIWAQGGATRSFSSSVQFSASYGAGLMLIETVARVGAARKRNESAVASCVEWDVGGLWR